MNLISSEKTVKIQSIVDWFSESIELIHQFRPYDQMQLIICAGEIGFKHPNIDREVALIANKEESTKKDFVFEFLEQLILMKYQVGVKRKQHFYDFWIEQKNYEKENLITLAYFCGYVAMKDNELSSAAVKTKAIERLKEIDYLPSISFTSWMVYYFDQYNEPNEAKVRFDQLMNARQVNGSWDDYALQTVQTAYPLSLSSFANSETLEKTSKFICAEPWNGYSEEINYETGLLKWLNSAGQLVV